MRVGRRATAGEEYVSRPPKLPCAAQRIAAMLTSLLFLLAYLAILWVASIPKGMAPLPYGGLVWGATASVALLLLTYAMLRRERRRWADVGLEPRAGSAWRFVLGVSLGFGVYALTMLLLALVAGSMRLTAVPAPSLSAVLLVLATTLALATMEEIGFRAYALRTLASAIGAWPAQLLIAVAFGLSHIAFGWNWQSVLFGVIPSGVLFGVTALTSRGLAMPIGVHTALNLAQWMIGEKESPGYWTVGIDAVDVPRVRAVAPFVGAGMTLGVAALLWYASRGSRAAVTQQGATR
jgi:membrane protease YdiL (CAAX protease family)